MFCIPSGEVFAPMVFCKECQQRVEDCPHVVAPIVGKRIEVFDPKVKSLAYDPNQPILEIAFKSGQVWQLVGVPAAIYQELRDSTISSFLKFHCAALQGFARQKYTINSSSRKMRKLQWRHDRKASNRRPHVDFRSCALALHKMRSCNLAKLRRGRCSAAAPQMALTIRVVDLIVA